jgi:hypothetical protein
MDEPAEYEVPQEVLQALGDQLTDEMITRLAAYATAKKNRLYWQSIRGGAMPEGLEPDDVVQNAVKKILTGDRRWDPSKHPDLFEYLTRSVIDSDMNHAAESWTNRHLKNESALTAKAVDQEDSSYFSRLESSQDDPETQLSAEEEAEASDQFLWDLLDDLGDDALLRGMVECIIDGTGKPREMAAALDVTTKEINNAKKRLKRRIDRFQRARNAT